MCPYLTQNGENAELWLRKELHVSGSCHMLPGFFTKVMKSLFPFRNIWMIKLFVNRWQIRLLNGKSTDLDW